MPIVRTAWDDFPPLVVHAQRTRLEQHPTLAGTYATAKRGDLEKARLLGLVTLLLHRAVIASLSD
jgi:hypothetical protein